MINPIGSNPAVEPLREENEIQAIRNRIKALTKQYETTKSDPVMEQSKKEAKLKELLKEIKQLQQKEATLQQKESKSVSANKNVEKKADEDLSLLQNANDESSIIKQQKLHQFPEPFDTLA